MGTGSSSSKKRPSYHMVSYSQTSYREYQDQLKYLRCCVAYFKADAKCKSGAKFARLKSHSDDQIRSRPMIGRRRIDRRNPQASGKGRCFYE